MSVDAGTLARLNILVGMDDSQAATAMTGLQKRTQALGANLNSIANKMMKGFTLPIIAAGVALIKVADTINQGVVQLRVQTGMTGEALDNLSASYRRVLSSSEESAKDVGMAMGFLQTRTGLVGEPLEKLTATVLDLADVARADLNSVLNTATRLFGDWSIATDKQGDALEFVWKASQNSGIAVDRLMSLIVQYGAPLRQMGFSFEQAAAMVAKFEAEGVNTELVMGSLRVALGKMAQEGVKDPARALGILVRRIKEAGSAGQANAIALEAFGARAGPDMAAAIREGRLDLDEFLKKLAASSETIAGCASDAETLGDKLSRLRNKIMLAVEPLGRELLVRFEKFIPTLEKGAERIEKWIAEWDELPESTKKIVGWSLAFLIAAGPVLKLLLLLQKGAALLGAAILGLPIWVIAGLAAVVYVLWQNWDKAAQAIEDYWNWLKAIWEWEQNKGGAGGGFAPGGGGGAGGGGGGAGGGTSGVIESLLAAPGGVRPSGIAAASATASRFWQAHPVTVRHSGTIRVEGVDNKDQVVAVVDLLVDDMRIDADRYANIPSDRRQFK